MTVQDLLDLLNEVQDKTVPVHLHIEYGYGCSMVVTDVDNGHENDFEDPDSEETINVFVLSGTEDDRFCE